MNRMNTLHEVVAELERMLPIVEKGAAHGLAAIERDLLLEKLRAVYDALLCTCTQRAEAPAAVAGDDDRPTRVDPPLDRGVIDSLYDDEGLCVNRAAECVPTEKTLDDRAETKTPPVPLVPPAEDFAIDLDSIMASRREGSLRSAIGLNDRLMLLNDLFEGSVERYEQTIDELDGFTDADDAYIYLSEHFTLDDSREGGRLLLSLVERKFA